MRLSLGEGVSPRTQAYWRWKHEASPFGASPCLLATAGGRVVGLRVFMRWEWRLNGRTISSVRAVDTATHPEWRGQGIFTRLTRALLARVEGEGVSFVFNTPNEKSRPGYLKMGWEDVGRVSLWVRPMRPGRVLMALLAQGTDESPEGTEDA
ncbi:MAG: GNAT family N-acetyltransferase, partial [Gemmatimonadota bacterium]